MEGEVTSCANSGSCFKVLLVHNRYAQRGGEDAVFEAERQLLLDRGHEVIVYNDDNSRIREIGQLDLVARTVWSRSTYAQLTELIRRERPTVAHFHNTFPLISPSAYYACRHAGAAIIQTLHNYRLMCPAATFFRAGRPCEDCLGVSPWRGILHSCYRRNRRATAVVAASLTVHRALRTYTNKVDCYIALTAWARDKFIEGGLPAAKISVKPNFVLPDPGVGPEVGEYALFVGRLAPEKGIETLLQAWNIVRDKVPLKIVGDGPLSARVSAAAANSSSIDWLGHQKPEAVRTLMHHAKFLVLPSEWYENLPMTLIEAYATGLPVIASDIGALTGLVAHGRTGYLFAPGQPQALALAINRLLGELAGTHLLRAQARREFEAKYTAARNYVRLVDVYGKALDRLRL